MYRNRVVVNFTFAVVLVFFVFGNLRFFQLLSHQHLLCSFNSCRQLIDLLEGVVEGETCADGAGDAEMFHYRFGAVLTRADGDAEFVENHSYIIIVCAVDVEGKYRHLVFGAAVDCYAADGIHLFCGVFEELFFVGGDVVETDGIHIFQSRQERTRANEIGRASLKFKRQVCPRGEFKTYILNHIAAALVGGHFFEIFFLAVKDADASLCVNLVSRQCEKIAVQLLNVDFDVLNRLRRVHEYGDIVGVGGADYFFDVVDSAECVGDVCNANYLCALVDEAFKCAFHEFAILVEGEYVDFCAATTRHQLPRNDVGMMLHFGDDDFVARGDVRLSKRKCKGVDRLGAALGEHNFGARLGIDEMHHLLTRLFVNLGRLFAKVMHAAMDVAIISGVESDDGIQHALRLLRRGGVVEIDERMTVYLLVEDWKILPYFVDVHIDV